MSDEHYLKDELFALLRDESEIFEFLQKGSLDGVWYWDLENPDHEWMSDEFWKLFGVEPGTRPHSPDAWQDIIDPEDLETALENFKAHIADPSFPYDQIVRYRHQVSGRTITVRCRGIAIRDKDGTPKRMLGAHTDLTRLANQSAELQRVIDSRDRFFRTMSHELRTPMNGIMGLTQLLKRGEKDGRRIRMFDAMEQSANALMGMLDGLLDYARIDAGQFDFNPTVIDPRDIVTECVSLYRSDFDDRAAPIRTNFRHAPSRTHISGAALRHVAQNLLSNAVKYGRGGEITVTLEGDEAGGVRLSVGDRGQGISAQDMPNVFDDFFQGEEGKTQGGAGIGLAFARRLCEGHGGSLSVRNRRDGGALFRAHLPEMIGSMTDDRGHETALKLLVADDVEINLLVVGEMLEAQGAKCTLARDGKDALEKLRAGGYDGALLDISMPVMSGTDVIRAYRKDPGSGPLDMPIASHSAHMQPDQLAAYRRAGFGFHLPKPVSIADVHRLTDWVSENARVS